MVTKASRAKQEAQSLSLADIRILAKLVDQYDLSTLELEQGGGRVIIRRERGHVGPVTTVMERPLVAPLPPPPPPAPAAPAPVQPSEKADDGTVVITSPFVGTFYRAPSPESAPFVEAGQNVKKGQVLCIVEAMKLMNEIEAETACKIVEILVKNAEPVEFGQSLFKVLPVA